jgi:hypothetical protein
MTHSEINQKIHVGQREFILRIHFVEITKIHNIGFGHSSSSRGLC